MTAIPALPEATAAGGRFLFGRAAIGGMIRATAPAIFFVPLFYEIVRERLK
jgi:multidrug efflux pump subunit AcrB